MIRVAHVITGLGGGGAEATLARLAAALPEDRFAQHVISLTDGGIYAAALQRECESVDLMGLQRGPSILAGMLRLRDLLVRYRPTLVQTWLCHADLLGTLAAQRAGGIPLVWGVHEASNSDRSAWLTRAVRWGRNRFLRSAPARVVCCAEAGRRACLAAGIEASRIRVIANGVDTDAYRPDAAARSRLRTELGIDPAAPVLAFAARWHVDKDPLTLLAAIASLRAQYPGLCVLMFGHGLDADNAALVTALREQGLGDGLHLLGFRRDAAALFAASDLAVLSSRSEALPNVVIEAMACGLPVVATAVGDLREVIGDCGRVVEPGQPAALAAALAELLAAPAALHRIGSRARQRVVERFAIARTAGAYATLYEDVAAAAGG